MCFDHNQCYVKLNLENAESFNDYNENKGTEDKKKWRNSASRKAEKICE